MSVLLSSLVGISYSSPASTVYAKAVPITFTPTFSSTPLSASALTYGGVWRFGDGSVSYDEVPTHVFNEQGVYKVSYTAFIPNSANSGVNDEVKTVTATLSVYNYINDSITWLSGAPGTFQAVPQDTPFLIALSSSSVETIPSVQLYSRGSRAQPWQDPQMKWSHLKPQWRFTDLSGNVVSNLEPTGYTTITIDQSGNRTFDGSGIIVGTSATVGCYYIDDLPSQDLDNNITPVTLVATLVVSGYNVEDHAVKYLPGHLNSSVKTELQHNIKFLEPTHLKVTVNGITPFESVVWKDGYTPYTVTVHPAAPYEDVILKNFPQTNFIFNTFTQWLSTFALSDVDFDTTMVLERYDDDGFDAGGYFRGSFIPRLSATNTVVAASGSVTYGILAEPFGAWVSNPYYNQIVFISIENTETGTDFVSSSFLIPNSQIYGIARVTGDINDASWVTDPTNDKIYKVTRSFGVDKTFDLTTYPQFSAVIADNAYGVTPTGVVLNSLKQPWVTLFDGVSTIKFDPTTGAVLAVAQPSATSTYIDYPGVSGFAGDDSIKPTKVEVDSNDNIWVAYNHPLSSFIVKYDTNGTPLYEISLPLMSKPYDMVSDASDNLWVTLSYAISGYQGVVAKYNTTGTLISAISGFRVPSYITLDHQQNAWFVHDYNLVTKVHSSLSSTNTYTLSSSVLSSDPPHDIELNVLYDQELGGISCDWLNKVWVLNSYDNRVYMIDATLPTNPFEEYQITPYSNTFAYSLQGYGDWHGLQWYNKFGTLPLSSLSGTVVLNLSGVSNIFAVKDFQKEFDFRKKNEDFDGVNKIRDITLQQNIKNNDVLFDKLIAPIAGTYDGDPLLVGTAVYEKIANFVANHADVDVCNIPQLYSLHEMIDIPIDQYALTYPQDIRRVMDLLSVALPRLKPTRSKFSKDFQKYNVSSSGRNISKLLDTNTYMVSAGVDLVANIKHTNYYEKIQVMPIGTEVLSVPELSGYYSTYPLSAFPLSSYPLSAYYGWGLDVPVGDYYYFYEYIPGTEDTQLEGVIDWDNTNTTLSENISSIDDWYKDGGIVDLIFNYYIMKGMGLIKD
jgi:streptogramin lyase